MQNLLRRLTIAVLSLAFAAPALAGNGQQTRKRDGSCGNCSQTDCPRYGQGCGQRKGPGNGQGYGRCQRQRQGQGGQGDGAQQGNAPKQAKGAQQR